MYKTSDICQLISFYLHHKVVVHRQFQVFQLHIQQQTVEVHLSPKFNNFISNLNIKETNEMLRGISWTLPFKFIESAVADSPLYIVVILILILPPFELPLK